MGIDVVPAQPPRGVSTIQGNFLDAAVQAEVRAYVQDPALGRPRPSVLGAGDAAALDAAQLQDLDRGYIDLERGAHLDGREADGAAADAGRRQQQAQSQRARDASQGRVVDVVLSDMCAPWEQTAGFHKRSLSDPYFRMMNTSGTGFRDHAGSMVREPLRGDDSAATG